MAATMLDQGKNIWQAESDSAAETCDFYRFNVHRTEYRPLEGSVYAISPFNFTAIPANLIVAPALMGNVVIWKPSNYALYSNYLQMKILEEAGLPANVIQFVPGDPKTVTEAILQHPQFVGLHYTGSTEVFRDLYGQISDGVREGRYYIFWVVHGSVDVRNAVVNTVRGAFEYQGQKCSATSRVMWPSLCRGSSKGQLVAETERLKMGGVEGFENFVGPNSKRDPSVTVLAGGETNREEGWFVQRTIFQAEDMKHSLMKEGFFGPILAVYVFPDGEFEETLRLVDSGAKFGLTGAGFARDRWAIELAEKTLRHSAGNFYINCKSSGAVVGHQPFGGSRASGTNDKATSTNLLSRFTSIRSIK
ncbi:Aldehyde/histidinol dehydrogenase [Aspergillus alliaceus]|uniref:L-glutamate gamma-semialdehyde dehydrogenase n=1 Tax=Petromyces alliaceus TaxID=209559 RepID=A0A5N7C0A3_PETAA|nr:Aldehyde/histidinol dehydrogenase [Aspergillus alliaceus]